MTEVEVDKIRDKLRERAEQCARDYRYEACTTPKRNKNKLMVDFIFKALSDAYDYGNNVSDWIEEDDTESQVFLEGFDPRTDIRHDSEEILNDVKEHYPDAHYKDDAPEPKFQEGDKVCRINDNRIGIVKSSFLVDNDKETYFYYNIYWVNGVESGAREDEIKPVKGKG